MAKSGGDAGVLHSTGTISVKTIRHIKLSGVTVETQCSIRYLSVVNVMLWKCVLHPSVDAVKDGSQSLHVIWCIHGWTVITSHFQCNDCVSVSLKSKNHFTYFSHYVMLWSSCVDRAELAASQSPAVVVAFVSAFLLWGMSPGSQRHFTGMRRPHI